MEACDHLFVYGTLRRGAQPNGHAALLHGAARFVGRGRVRGRLYRVSWYPGLVDSDDGHDTVVGDVFALPAGESLLAALDAYEDARSV
jgi:gamma-glutamylcyclotransferase (GGCT)/AIG2-like uncharacterized protein YtfP